MAFPTTNTFSGNGFGAFSQSSTPSFTWPQQQQPATPAFTQSAPTASLFPQQPQAAPVGNSDKGQILACLNESKNVQVAILQQLQSMNEKIGQQQPNVLHPQAVSFKPTHVGVFCNVCSKNNIMGARYKCLFCKDFDMCEECEAKTINGHDSSHVFIKIKDSNAFNSKMSTKPTLFTS